MKQLKPKLGLGAVISISISSMLGSGIFVLPGMAILKTGPSAYLAYLFAALCVLPAALSKSELATAMPTSGGTYVYLERTFGPFAGTVAGLGLWLSLLLKSAFALVGIGAYLTLITQTVSFIPSLDLKTTVLCLLFFITLVNMLGVGKVSSSLIIIISVTLTTLFLLSIGSAFTFDANLMTPLFPMGQEGFLNAAALVFVSYAGVTKVAAIAEEIKSPERNLHRGILISLGLVTLLYCLINFLLAGNFPISAFEGNYAPIYSLAEKVTGKVGGIIAALVGILTMASMANAGVLAASRFPFAMGRDRLLPSIFGRLHKNWMTPVTSILISGIIVAVSVTLLPIQKIAKLASAFMIMIYLSENVAVIVLREARVQWYKPKFKAPLYPFPQIFGILSSFILLFVMGNLAWQALASIGIPGALLYLFYSRRKVDRKGVIGMRGKRVDLVTNPEPSTLSPHEPMDPSFHANVVVPLFGKERSAEVLIGLGAGFLDGDNRSLEVAHLLEVPEQTNLRDIVDEPPLVKSLRRRVVAMAVDQKIPITFDPVVTYDRAKTIYEISQRLHCQWIVTEWGGKHIGAFTSHDPIGWLRGHLQCNLAIFRDAGVRYVRKILVLIRGNSNDYLALDTADHLAGFYKADITLIKFVTHKKGETGINHVRTSLEKQASQLNHPSFVEIRPLEKGQNLIQGVREATAEYDLLVFGASEYRYMKNIIENPDDNIYMRAVCSVVSVENCGQIN